MYNNWILLVDSDFIGGGSVEEVVEGGLQWLLVEVVVTAGCCAC